MWVGEVVEVVVVKVKLRTATVGRGKKPSLEGKNFLKMNFCVWVAESERSILHLFRGSNDRY